MRILSRRLMRGGSPFCSMIARTVLRLSPRRRDNLPHAHPFLMQQIDRLTLVRFDHEAPSQLSKKTCARLKMPAVSRFAWA